jgi:hypothetical protein
VEFKGPSPSQQKPLTDPILSQFNPVHIPKTSLPEIHFNIILTFRFELLQLPSSVTFFQSKFFVHFSFNFMSSHKNTVRAKLKFHCIPPVNLPILLVCKIEKCKVMVSVCHRYSFHSSIGDILSL